MSVILSLSFLFAHRCRLASSGRPSAIGAPSVEALVVDSDPNAVP